MVIEIKTLVLVSIFAAFISAFALFLFHRLSNKVDGLKYAAMGGVFLAVASLLLLTRDRGDPTLSIMLTNSSYFLSLLLYYQAARLLSGKKKDWVFPATLIIVALPLIFLLRGQDVIAGRAMISSLVLGVLFLTTSFTVWKDPEKLAGRMPLVLSLLLAGLLSLLTCLMLLFKQGEIHVLSELRIIQVVFLWFIINNILITLAFIIFASEKLQQQLKQQMELLEKARDIADQSLKQQHHFLSMLSHEFKAPLGAIKANADAVLLTQKVIEPSSKESLDRIKKVSDRLTTLVDHCLNNEWLAHSIASDNVRLEPVSLTDIVSKVCEELSVQFKHSNKQAIINGEPMFLPVLFYNLITNACRYANNNSSVDVELEEDDNHFYIHVLDDGSGIEEEEQQHIFERYYQTASGTGSGGTGLGLYFVKCITEIHGGKVTVSCQEKTKFTIKLAKLEQNNA